MNSVAFQLFNEQQQRFSDALREYDPQIWFPPLRGGFKVDNPANWFIGFVPSEWGRWKGATFGVHFDFIYARSTANRPESFRLAVGVEVPMIEQFRQGFKEDVIEGINASGISQAGYTLKAENRKKLLECDAIPFGRDSWQIAADRYVSLKPTVEVIGQLIREYVARGAFSTAMTFRAVEQNQNVRLLKLLYPD